MLKIDSRKVVSGDTFLALRGVNTDGHNYILDAIKNGATRVIVEEGLYDVETIIVDDTKKYLEEYLYNNYYDKISKLKLIGITGTNGKTTTSFLIYQSLNKNGIKCAYIGTIGFYTDKRIDTSNTTPNLYELYNMLINCVDLGYDYVVMEVSSQGLAMGRVNTLKFDYVIFTNLTMDHLDYHVTMENYMKEKLKLFSMTRDGIAIINNDDIYSKNFLLDNNKNITYGKSGDYVISDIDMDVNGTKFKLNNKDYCTKLRGEYNVYNISIVIILLDILGISKDVIGSLEPPVGRMEIVKYNENLIIIDFAHTPDALDKILDTVSNIKHNKIITVIGCGGNRDKVKRHLIGSIATSKSDYVIFTSDNPRNEDPMEILDDITSKLDTKNFEIIVNREESINKSIQMLSKNDILLLLGKGHENYQIIGNKKIPFNDKETVFKIIGR